MTLLGANVVIIGGSSGTGFATARCRGSSYGCHECAVEVLAKGLAPELAPVRVNAIAPGLTDTPLIDEGRTEAAKWVDDKLPVRRMGLAEEVAQAVLLLMTNGFITGEVLHIDGGGRLI